MLCILLQRRWCWSHFKSFRHRLTLLLASHSTTFPPSSTNYRYVASLQMHHRHCKSERWGCAVHAHRAKGMELQRERREEPGKSLVQRGQGELLAPLARMARWTGKQVLVYPLVCAPSSHQALAQFPVRQSSRAEADGERCSHLRLCAAGYVRRRSPKTVHSARRLSLYARAGSARRSVEK